MKTKRTKTTIDPYFNPMDIMEIGVPRVLWCVLKAKCRICGHMSVNVFPETLDETTLPCGECGHHSVGPDDDGEDEGQDTADAA